MIKPPKCHFWDEGGKRGKVLTTPIGHKNIHKKKNKKVTNHSDYFVEGGTKNFQNLDIFYFLRYFFTKTKRYKMFNFLKFPAPHEINKMVWGLLYSKNYDECEIFKFSKFFASLQNSKSLKIFRARFQRIILISLWKSL